MRRKTGKRATRLRLLEIAGQVFAEKGLAGATGKEICGRAKANVAAINYHFRDMDGLYAAVLKEAAKRLPNAEAIRTILVREKDPQAMLSAVIDLVVRAFTSPVSSSWVMQVVGRETLNPSPAFVVLQKRKIRPRMLLLRRVVGEIMKLPPSHPAVERSCVSVLAPCWLLLLGHRSQLKRAFPGFGFAPQDASAITRHLVRFALGGMAAAAAQARG
jgi:TetR/AcrR family transcriptional regulator, regulator of cefoperazone and chloramphenicol sensitivity